MSYIGLAYQGWTRFNENFGFVTTYPPNNFFYGGILGFEAENAILITGDRLIRKLKI